MIRFIVRFDSRRDGFEDLGRDGRLVVCVVVLRNELLDLRGGQDPTDIEEYLDIAHCCLSVSYGDWSRCDTHLLELKKLRGLHEVFQLEQTFRHVVGFAPFCGLVLSSDSLDRAAFLAAQLTFNSSDVVLYLHSCFVSFDPDA